MPRLEKLVIRGDEPEPRSLVQRGLEAMRSLWLGPWNAKDPALARLWGGPPSATGVRVNEDTALNFSAVWNAVGLISGHIGALPLKLYRRTANGGKEEYREHRLHKLLHDTPNPVMSAVTFRETLQAHLLLWGNAYAEIERDHGGRVVALWPLLPCAVQPFWQTATGPIRYRVVNPSGTQVEIPSEDMLHIRGLSENGIVGMSAISKARESIGLGLATERFGATFFGNGSTFGGVISYPAGLNATPQSREESRKKIEAEHQGVDRAHRFLVLYEGATYERLGIPPDDAQFLETRRFQVEEIARWFNLPPHKLKHLERATFSNIEHQGIEYVQDTLWPWVRRWEAELTRKLIAPLEQNIQFFEFTLDGLLRGDAAGRAQLYQTMFQVGAITPNEIRARENLNPIPGGDVTYVPGTMAAVERKWEDLTPAERSMWWETDPATAKQMSDEADLRERQAAYKKGQQR